MNAVLEKALHDGAEILVVFAHGGDYTRKPVPQYHNVQVWFYTPPGECIWNTELKPIIASLKKGSVPAEGPASHVRLRTDSSNIADTRLVFYDSERNIESMCQLDFGLHKLSKARGLQKWRVPHTDIPSMASVVEKARSEGIHHILQLSCKAATSLAHIIGPCGGCRGGQGRIRLQPRSDGQPINALMDNQCLDCMQRVNPRALLIAGHVWGLNMSVLRGKTGTIEVRQKSMKKASGTVARPEQYDFDIPPGDSIRELAITLQ